MKFSRMSKKALALFLVLAMFMSVCTPVITVVAEGADEGTADNKLNYVSLGDSMTNGYGLEGYDGNTGVADYGTGSYANQFADYIGANHTQLAMSAMRAEDLHWLLEVDYEDEAVVALIEELAAKGSDYYKANIDEFNAKWYSVFTNGDFWTWNELVNNYRFDVAAYAIEGRDTEGVDFTSAARAAYTDVQALQIVAPYYQNAVANADIISLGIGNGNFGVFMFGRIMEAIGFTGTAEDTALYDIENAIRECDPETQAQIRALMAELEAVLAEYGIEANDGDDTVLSTMEAMYNSLMYAFVSYALNYAGTVEAILALNPDAEIIQVALMNTMGEGHIAGDVTLSELMDAAFIPLNA